MARGLVTDAQIRNSLAIIDSSGRRGVQLATGYDAHSVTGSISSFYKVRVVYPGSLRFPDKFTDALFGRVNRTGPAIVYIHLWEIFLGTVILKEVLPC